MYESMFENMFDIQKTTSSESFFYFKYLKNTIDKNWSTGSSAKQTMFSKKKLPKNYDIR